MFLDVLMFCHLQWKMSYEFFPCDFQLFWSFQHIEFFFYNYKQPLWFMMGDFVAMNFQLYQLYFHPGSMYGIFTFPFIIEI